MMGGRSEGLQRQRVQAAWGFLIPGLTMLAVVGAWPLIRTIWLSFTDAILGGGGTAHFVGWTNYRLLLSDPAWWASVGNTVIFAVISVALETQRGLERDRADRKDRGIPHRSPPRRVRKQQPVVRPADEVDGSAAPQDGVREAEPDRAGQGPRADDGEHRQPRDQEAPGRPHALALQARAPAPRHFRHASPLISSSRAASRPRAGPAASCPVRTARTVVQNAAETRL